MDSSGRIVRGKLEVADRDTRKSVKGLERNLLRQRDVIKDGSECSNTEFVRRDSPLEAWVMKQEDREVREPIK